LRTCRYDTYVFDVWARVDGDHITVLDAQVVANNTVYPCRAIVEVVICEHDQDCVLALLALDQDSVTAEELERLHGVVREGDNRVVIVDGIGDTARVSGLCQPGHLWHLHQGVGLLLLLEDGCCDLVVLWRVSISDLSMMSSGTYALRLSA
jgi:hypothetical protein